MLRLTSMGWKECSAMPLSRLRLAVLFVARFGAVGVAAAGGAFSPDTTAFGFPDGPPALGQRAGWDEEIAAGFFVQGGLGHGNVVGEGGILNEIAASLLFDQGGEVADF